MERQVTDKDLQAAMIEKFLRQELKMDPSNAFGFSSTIMRTMIIEVIERWEKYKVAGQAKKWVYDDNAGRDHLPKDIEAQLAKITMGPRVTARVSYGQFAEEPTVSCTCQVGCSVNGACEIHGDRKLPFKMEDGKL